ncbi:MAG: phospholipid carrier-dependent glycosyltransferase [Candidatus Hydrogenedentes bacterium]|nr:phospholipid carrier-dependent glycosyltransferase [Candidatus Hydrogenedentota bacterium]
MTTSESATGRAGGLSRRWTVACVLAAAAVFAAGASFLVPRYLSNPRHPFLMGEGGAKWIRLNEEVNLVARPLADAVSAFRVHFTTGGSEGGAQVSMKAMKAGQVFLDGALVYSTGPEFNKWKETRRIDLTGRLGASEHELKVLVVNRDGPPCLLAYCPQLKLATGPQWESSADGQTWSPAVTVDAYRPAGLSRKFPRADTALLRSLPLVGLVFAGVLAWSLALSGEWRISPWVRRLTPRASTYRWLLMGGLGVMAANNIFKLPFYHGFDFKGHVEYVEYVVQHWAIPLPTQGWTMFQAPLYYVLTAPLYAACALMFEPEQALQALRVLPLACGVLQVELAYRVGRRLWPDRDGLQMAATTVGGLLPASVYMSQYVGNEPLAGVLAGLVVVLALRFYYAPYGAPYGEPDRGRRTWSLVMLGIALGLALLSKLTALFLIPPVAALIVYGFLTAPGERKARRAVVALLLVFGTAAFVGGWYYARNYVLLGRAFWGGWEPERNIQWWQDPGYRTLAQLIPRGEALVYPVCSSLVSFWDGFYSTLWADGYISSTTDANYAPPWNYNLMLGGVLLSLIPTSMIFAGAAAAFRKRVQRPGLVFLGGTLLLYIVMLIYGFFSLPYYCITKAAYTLGLACCYGALAAAGFDLLARGRLARAVLAAGIAAWAAAAYGAYFIVK